MPAWLGVRMRAMARVITEAICWEYGRDEFLRRLAHPFWFQSFGSVMGMDWHSSGITTSVMGALKRGLADVQDELGLFVCGGRGRHSRKTPAELVAVGEHTGLDGDALAHASRLVAKVDSAAVQDGFQLYLHSFVVTADGSWVVVQQGMNQRRREARRYHWLSSDVDSFVEEPHSAIEGPGQGQIVNLTDARAAASRAAQVALLADGPDRALDAIAESRGAVARQAPLPHLHMPAHHDVQEKDVVLRRLHGALAAAAERGPVDFADLLMTPGVGARTVESLALAAEVIHGTPSRFTDPARFSYAHGGKDGHPFPVPTRVYDRTITVLREAVDKAKLGNEEQAAAIKRLDREARRLERVAAGEDLGTLFERERRDAGLYGGRTVFGQSAHQSAHPEPQAKPASRRTQLALPGL